MAATLLLMLQLGCGTHPAFALLVFVFVLVTGIAFNVAGGLQSIAGLSITMMALKTVLIAQVAKVIHWQPADSNLDRPITTIAVFVLGFLSMTFGVVLAGKSRSRPWIAPITDKSSLLLGTVVCGVLGLLSALVIFRQGIDTGAEEHARGGLLGLASIVVRLLPMSIVFATTYVIVKSEGQRSFSWLVFATIGTAMAFAAVQGTKQGVFETVLYYVLACVAWRFSFRRKHLLTLAFAGLVGIVVVWPVLQTLKSVTLLTSVSISERIELMGEALSEMKSIGDFFEASDTITEVMSQDPQFQYYGHPAGWLDRFSLIEPADELVLATEKLGELGWETPVHAVRGLIPSAVDPKKPVTDTGNMLGHRIGYLHPKDDITQIAFGIIPESYASFRWTGVLLLPAALMLIFVLMMRRLAGPLTSSVWTVYLFGRLQHTFVEQSISTFVRELLVLPLILGIIVGAIGLARSIVSWRTRASEYG